jgi:hypothetical protein
MATSAVRKPVKSRAIIEHAYYDYSRLYSYQAVFNFPVGGRGIGKTYGAKRGAIRDYLRDGSQFIYLRRYKTELSSRFTFFDDLIAKDEFPEWDFRINGFRAEIAPKDTAGEKKRSWETIGYFIALSNSQMQKSVAFPRVRKILYDEFIIEKGAIHYLPDEPTVMMNFYNTVDRFQDKTIVIFMANAVAIDNPYFIKWDITPDDPEVARTGGFLRRMVDDTGQAFILVHFVDAADFSASALKTRFGKFIAGSEYAEYAVANQFSDNNKQLVGFKNDRAKYLFTLEAAKGTFSIWWESADNKYFVQKKQPRGDLQLWTLLAEKMNEDKTLMLPNDKPLQSLRTSFRQGKVWFDTPATRNAFIEIFSR